MSEKKCTKCKIAKPLLEFYKLKNGNYLSECKACRIAYSRQYYINNKEKVLTYVKEYQKTHREVNRRAERKHHYSNLEKSRARRSLYKKLNKDKVNANTAYRRSRKLQATPIWANKEEIKKIYKQAADLTKTTGIIYSVDHIVPLRNPKVCGLHVEHNLRVIPLVENIRKNNTLWDTECLNEQNILNLQNLIGKI